MHLKLVFYIVILSILSFNINAQKKADIFYLSIGQNYNKSREQLQHCSVPLRSLSSGNNSAKSFSNELEKWHTKFGITLISDEKNHITKANIEKALQIISDSASKDSNDIIFFFYFYGHGIADSLWEKLYLLPGNIVCQDDFYASGMLEKNAISVYTLMDYELRYFKRNTPCIFLLDCCYTLKRSSEDAQKMAEFINEQAKSVTGKIKNVNQTRHSWIQNTNAVIFISSHIGTSSQSVPNPNDINGDRIGLMCRRFLLASDSIHNTPSLKYLLSMLRSVSDPTVLGNSMCTVFNPVDNIFDKIISK